MLRLSIIVPFYNVEKYIEECIRSLYDQDIPHEEYEVICVDDCSPDGSRAIVEQLQQEYPTLKLLTHTENKRQGGARNTGMQEAKGRYVWFVDSDDIIFRNVLKKLLGMIEKNRLDILQFDYVRGVNKSEQYKCLNGDISCGEDYLFRDKSPLWYDRLVGPWRQLFRKQFLIEEHLSFIEKVQYEDTDYLLHSFMKAQRVQHISVIAYGYRVNSSSTTCNGVSYTQLAWKINQITRCLNLSKEATYSDSRKMIENMVASSLSAFRKDLKLLDTQSRMSYRKILSKDIITCKPYINWRTWLAIRYGITWFI